MQSLLKENIDIDKTVKEDKPSVSEEEPLPKNTLALPGKQGGGRSRGWL